MAHNIQKNDRQEGLAQAWHGLTVIRPDLALDSNFLTEWEIFPREVYVRLEDDGELISLPNVRQLVGSDNNEIIGMPYNKETFRPLTNAEFLGMVREAMTGTEHKLISIGTIRNRGRRFASFSLEALESYKAGGRTFHSFLNYGDGLDKSSALWANTSNIATVCDNTFNMNLFSTERGGAGSLVREKHTAGIIFKLPAISKLIDAAVGVQLEFANAFETLANIPVSKEQAVRIYAGFVAAPDVTELSTRSGNIVDRLAELFVSGRGNRGESRADLFSAVTEYYTHEASGNGKNPTRQFASSEFGTGADRKRVFFDIVQDEDKFARLEDRGALLLKA
jgi:hypothetical protein